MTATDILRRSRKDGASAVQARENLVGDCGCKDGAEAPTSSSGVFDILAGAAIGLVMSVLVLG